MAKQQTLTFIVQDGARDPAEMIENALLQTDYCIISEVADPEKFKSLGDVVVIIEED